RLDFARRLDTISITVNENHVTPKVAVTWINEAFVAASRGRTIMTRHGAALTRSYALIGIAAGILTFSWAAAHAADPIKIGLSLSLTGATAPAGKQVQTGLEIWRDHVNARGGLLGRPVELVYYDDQANPA